MNNIKFDLEERTAKFGEAVIEFVKALPKSIILNPLISQIVRSATSIGANYCEADDAESSKDICHKLSIAKKEARETMHWLRMISVVSPESKNRTRELWIEAKELNLIFNAILIKIRSKN